MAGSPTPTDCPFDEPRDATDVGGIDWEVSFTDQFAGATPSVPSRTGTPVPVRHEPATTDSTKELWRAGQLFSAVGRGDQR
jgi:hypothetical protein